MSKTAWRVWAIISYTGVLLGGIASIVGTEKNSGVIVGAGLGSFAIFIAVFMIGYRRRFGRFFP